VEIGYFGVSGARERWWRFGWERRWGEKRAEGVRERVGELEVDWGC
jgi:hypothetical protein